MHLSNASLCQVGFVRMFARVAFSHQADMHGDVPMYQYKEFACSSRAADTCEMLGQLSEQWAPSMTLDVLLGCRASNPQKAAWIMDMRQSNRLAVEPLQ